MGVFSVGSEFYRRGSRGVEASDYRDFTCCYIHENASGCVEYSGDISEIGDWVIVSITWKLYQVLNKDGKFTLLRMLYWRCKSVQMTLPSMRLLPPEIRQRPPSWPVRRSFRH